MNNGFTATELIVVIVILGILAILSVSRFNAYLAKGRQAEAKVNLTMIGALQETWKFGRGCYNGDSDTVKCGGLSGGVGAFGATNTTNKCGTGTDGKQMKNELGFRPKDCDDLKYGYSWTSTKATAKSTTNEDKYIYPGCDKIDTWTLTYASAKLKNTAPSVIKRCIDD